MTSKSKNELMATGKVTSLSINGKPSRWYVTFTLDGPYTDSHSGLVRKLSDHDGVYTKTSHMKKGAKVFNWRSWTALSLEEIEEIESSLKLKIPQGCLLENIVISGIPNFSKLKPTTRLVFQSNDNFLKDNRAVLAVWEENGPCGTVGKRLEEHHKKPGLKTDFIAAAQNKRGLMGIVLYAGIIAIGDSVLVYPPVE